MKKLLRLVLSVGILMILMVILGGCSSTQKSKAGSEPSSGEKSSVKVMKIATANAKDRSLSKALYKFAEIVSKETNGGIKVEVYTDAVLGDDRRILEGLQMGTIEGGVVAAGPISSFAPEMGVFDLPYLFKDKQSAYKVLDGEIGQKVLDKLPTYKFIGLVYGENGFRHLTNSRREVTTLEDIKGLKIRTMEAQLHVDIWKALGANPTPMSWSQVYSALEQKVVDGQENPLGNVVSNRLYEVQKYLTLTGHVYNASPLLISKVFWDTLNDKEKEILKKAAIEWRDYQRKLAEQEDSDAMKILTEKGMKISELKPGEKEKMREAVMSVYQKYKPVYGEELVNKILDATK